MSCENPNRFIQICVDGEPVGAGNPLPTSIGGSGSGVVITDVEDGAGTSVMDPANDAMRVNVVAGGSSNFYGVAPTDAANRDIDVGGISQQVFAANADRSYLLIQNLSTASLWINFGAAATLASPSIELIAGPTGYIEYGPGGGSVPDGAIHIIGATTGQSFAAKEATGSGGGGGGGGGGSVIVTDIEDGAGDSVMDAVNDAIRVNVVAGGAGGGAVTIADGADVTQGAQADAAASSDTGTFSIVAFIKRILTKMVPIFARDSASGATDSGVVPMAVWKPFGNDPLADTDGDYSPMQLDGDGSLKVKVTGTVATSGSENSRPLVFYYDPAGFQFPVFEDTEYQVGATPNGAMHVCLRDNDGVERGTAGNPVAVDVISGGGSSVITDIEDGAGDSVMDAANDAIRVNVVAGGTGGGVITDIEDGAGDSVMDAANDAIRVNIVAGAGSGGTALADESAFTEGTTSLTPIGGVFNDALASDPTAGQAAAARITGKRALHTNLRDATGTEIGTSGAPVRTDPTGTTAQPITDNAGSLTVDAPVGIPLPIAVTDPSDMLVKVGDAVNEAIRVNVVAGGGGGAVTIADGDDAALGATADAAATTDAGTFSLIALFKRLLEKFTTQFPAALVSGRFDVNIGASSATVPVSAASLPLPTGASTEATLATRLSESDFDTKIGSLTETAPATDTASSGLNGRLQRIAQRLTSLIALVPAALTGSGNFKTAIQEAIPAGTNNIGDVDVLTLPAGTVAGGASLPAGTNNIGDVDVLTLPALPAGTNNIGDVDVLTLPGIAGTAAHDAAISGNPVRIGARALTADYTAVTTGDTADLIASILGKLVTLRGALPGNTWNYAAVAGGLVSTAGVTAKAAAGTGIRNYISKVSIVNSHPTISTEVVIRDGAAGTVLWRGWAQAGGGGQAEVLDPPLRGATDTLVEIAEITATATTGVLVNIQGYTAAE